ncbi:alpha/beta hydrolase [Bacillus sp. 2205SS5-2]|uniref:alpha/beta hydrolase n=1 Tax=Bacillus sp. 2205SS5-2 TaxID=3109031 RepID=UPI00300646A6
MKEKFLSIDNYRVRYNVWGGNKDYSPIIVCLHGFGNTSLSFIEIGEELKKDYTIISIDLPGHGKSEKFATEKEYEMVNMTKWLYKVTDKMNLGKFYLLAHSYGADITLHFMKDYGSCVMKTLLLDGGYTTKDDFYKIVDELAGKPEWQWPNINDVEKEIQYTTDSFNKFEYPNFEAFYSEEEKSNKNWSNAKKIASKDYVQEINGKVKPIVDAEVVRSVIQSMANSPIKEIYTELGDNILLLVATLPEEFTIINNTLLEDVQKNSKMTIKKIQDTTHMIHWDNAEAVIEEIRNYFISTF